MHPHQPAHPHQQRQGMGTMNAQGVQALPQASSPVAHGGYVPQSAAATAPSSSPPWRTIILWVVSLLAAVVLAFGVFTVIGITALNYGGLGAIIAVGVMIPAACSLLVIILISIVADRWDPQPVPLLLAAVAWGGGVATTISLVVNTTVGTLLGDAAATMFSAPVVEESSKGFGLVVALVLARRYFTGPLDGLVYGALIGGGFAFVENILYYANGTVAGIAATESLSGGLFNLALTVVVRGVIGILGHVGYTSLTGIIMGFVARRWGILPGALVYVVAVIPGMILHALWNTSSLLGLGVGFSLFMFAVEMLFGALWLGLMFFLMFEQSRFMRHRLEEYQQAGWFSPQEVQMLATWNGRRHGRSWAKSIGQKDRMKRFIRDATELSHTRQVIRADGPKPKPMSIERRLLQAIGEHRAALQATAGAPHRI